MQRCSPPYTYAEKGAAMALDQIDLAALPKKDQREFYTLVEVRFFVAGEPPWGECQGDRVGYTRAPG